MQPSSCPPWQPEPTGPSRRIPRRAPGSYTTARDTISTSSGQRRRKPAQGLASLPRALRTRCPVSNAMGTPRRCLPGWIPRSTSCVLRPRFDSPTGKLARWKSRCSWSWRDPSRRISGHGSETNQTWRRRSDGRQQRYAASCTVTRSSIPISVAMRFNKRYSRFVHCTFAPTTAAELRGHARRLPRSRAGEGPLAMSCCHGGAGILPGSRKEFGEDGTRQTSRMQMWYVRQRI